jgi:peptide deformylase
MAVRDIVYFPDAPLCDKAAPVEEFTPELVALAQDMIDTMHAYDGVGLAGPQIGLSKRIFVMCEPDGEPLCIVNPEIIDKSGSALGEEGCLSMPRVYAQVPRATWLKLRAFDEYGEPMEFEATDFAARIIQHEFDHLEGILFPDRLDILSREDKLREWEQNRAELMQALKSARA